MDTQRCQSCGMPLGTPGYYGTEADGSENKDYCTFCYQKRSFSQPNITLPEMIESSVKFMTTNLRIDEKTARDRSEKVIPPLRRWKK